MLLNPIGKQSILNGSSVDMYDLVSRDCNLECYAKFLDKNNVKGKIEFDNVVFQYDNNDKPTIKNVFISYLLKSV